MQAPALVCAMGCTFALPAMLGVVIAPTFWGSMVFFFLECVGCCTLHGPCPRKLSLGGAVLTTHTALHRYLIAESWFGPAFALMQALVPANVVGVASSVFVCVAMLVRG